MPVGSGALLLLALAVSPDTCAPGECFGSEGNRVVQRMSLAPPARGREPTVFCAIYTHHPRHSTGCAAIKATWGAECDQLLFVSDRHDPSLPARRLAHDGEESYDNLWQKVRSAWRMIHRDFLEDFDFFLIGGDDLYVAMSNLRWLLRDAPVAEPDSRGEPLYLGRRMRQVQWSGSDLLGVSASGQAFNSGGAGYVLNKMALRLLGPELAKPHKLSPQCAAEVRDSAEDVRVAACLEHLGVLPADTRDAAGEERFHPFNPGDMATTNINPHVQVPGSADWFAKYVAEFRPRTGLACCSRFSVSFHYMTPVLMHEVHRALIPARKWSKAKGSKQPPPIGVLPSPYTPRARCSAASVAPRPPPAPSGELK